MPLVTITNAMVTSERTAVLKCEATLVKPSLYTSAPLRATAVLLRDGEEVGEAVPAVVGSQRIVANLTLSNVEDDDSHGYQCQVTVSYDRTAMGSQFVEGVVSVSVESGRLIFIQSEL